MDGLGGVFRSTDNGDSWTDVSQGEIEFDVRALAVNSNGHILAGTYVGGTIGGDWRSTDDGESWTHVNNGGTAASSGRWQLIRRITFLPEPPVAVMGDYRSTDNGDNWDAG